MNDSATPHVRRVAVFNGATLALVIEDRPGTLHSTAAPGPAGPPQHPFLHGEARDTLSEHELGMLLQEAADFDSYLRLLVGAGYDLRLPAGSLNDLSRPPRRILDAEGNVVAVRWTGRGGVTGLNGERHGPATLPRTTLYQQEAAERVVYSLRKGLLTKRGAGPLRLS